MTHDQLIALLEEVGIPASTRETMALQLEKRASQLAERRNQTCEESLAHLVLLLKQGWAAKKNHP